MKLNRIELKKIMYDFNSISNRFMRVHFNDYNHVIVKFLEFLRTTDIINDFINDCGAPTFNVEEVCKQVASSYGRSYFDLGDSDRSEIANIFGILEILANNETNIIAIGRSYSASNGYQDMVKGFNERVLMVLIRHIDGYLTKIGIDMGMDENAKYSITVNNGQVNLASDNSTITAVQNNGVNTDEIKRHIVLIKEMVSELTVEDKESAIESLEAIETEVASNSPKKSMLRTALTTLKAIKGTAEFGVAVATLTSFIQTLV